MSYKTALSAIVLGCAIALPQSAVAAESTSFRLNADLNTYEAHTAHSAPSYQGQGGLSWHQQPLEGSNFQIVQRFVATSSSSSSAAASQDDGAAADDYSPSNAGARYLPHLQQRSDSSFGGSESSGRSFDSSTDASRGTSSRSSVSDSSRSGDTDSSAGLDGGSSSRGTLPTIRGALTDGGATDGIFSPSTQEGISDFMTVHPAAGDMVIARPTLHFAASIASCMERFPLTILMVLCIAIGFCMGLLFRRSSSLVRRVLTTIALLLLFILSSMLMADVASAVTTTPQRHVYNGYLLDSNGSPITTAHSIRFSYWTSADAVAGDINGDGSVNTSAAEYAGWTEVQTVTPNAEGYFSVQLGSVTALPDLSTYELADLLSLYLQVEVKASANADTEYEILDVDGNDDTIDRSTIASLPFAQNADLLDQREIGTGSGSIPLLQSGGVLSTASIPSGLALDTFTIDTDDSAGGDITLRFGATLDKTLVYSQSNNRFEFNDDVNVTGDLTVTGLINGINISDLQSASDTYLRVSSGAGLNVNVGGGSYRLRGSVTNYNGDSNVAMADDTTNYVYLTSTGVNVATSGFPTNRSYLPLAEVTASAGGVSTIVDRRILSSDDREETIETVLHAAYPGASYQPDGSNNVGQLAVNTDDPTLRNHYGWTSTKAALQDYDILVRFRLPDDFAYWSDNPLRLTYRSDSADSADNALDLAIFDTTQSAVTLSGSVTGLANTSWTTAQADFIGSPTWTAGQDVVVRIRLYSKEENAMQAAELQLHYVSVHSD